MKKNILALILVLIIALQAVPALALDLDLELVPRPHTETEAEPVQKTEAPAFVKKLARDIVVWAFGDDAMPPIEEEEKEETIVPFLNISWEDVMTYGESVEVMCDEDGISYSGYLYDITMHVLVGGYETTIIGIIVDEEQELPALVEIWKDVGADMLAQFGTGKQVESARESSMMAYEFENDETYVLLELIDSEYADYISYEIKSK